jgi:hypothetical protein
MTTCTINDLETYFNDVRPSKKANIPIIMKTYHNNWGEMCKKLADKYGETPTLTGEPGAENPYENWEPCLNEDDAETIAQIGSSYSNIPLDDQMSPEQKIARKEKSRESSSSFFGQLHKSKQELALAWKGMTGAATTEELAVAKKISMCLSPFEKPAELTLLTDVTNFTHDDENRSHVLEYIMQALEEAKPRKSPKQWTVIEKAFVLLTHLVKRASQDFVDDLIGSKTFLRKFTKDAATSEAVDLLKLLDDKHLLDAARENKPVEQQEAFDAEEVEVTEVVEVQETPPKADLIQMDDWQVLPEHSMLEEDRPVAPTVDPNIQELLAIPNVPTPNKCNQQNIFNCAQQENMIRATTNASSMKISELFEMPAAPNVLAQQNTNMQQNHQGFATSAAMMQQQVLNGGNMQQQQNQQAQYNNGWAW